MARGYSRTWGVVWCPCNWYEGAYLVSIPMELIAYVAYFADKISRKYTIVLGE